MPKASGLRADSDGIDVAEGDPFFSSISVQRTPTRPCCGSDDGVGKPTESSNVSPRFKSKRFSQGPRN